MADTEKQVLGKFGEDIAADYLEKNGYRITERNLHIAKNELDIIAEDKDCIVFVEVKTRTCLYPEWGGYGVPSRAVDHKKRGNIVKAAKDYLFSYYGGKQPRIDVIEVYVFQRAGESFSPTVLNVNHIRNAVDARGRRLH
jgi:putative endonuclease